MSMTTDRISTAMRFRLSLLVALALAVALLLGGLAADRAAGDEHIDAPSGFSVTVLAPHGSFPDDVSAQFRFRYDVPGHPQGAFVSNLKDAGAVVVGEVNWAPGGTSGWHTHPGPAVVSVVQGTLEVTNAHDCVTRTYGPGEAFIDPGEGNVHTAANASDTQPARAYAMFFGVPPGTPATVHVAPADC